MNRKQIISNDSAKAIKQINLIGEMIYDHDHEADKILDNLLSGIRKKYKNEEDIPNRELNEVACNLLDLIQERLHLW